MHFLGAELGPSWIALERRNRQIDTQQYINVNTCVIGFAFLWALVTCLARR